MIYIPTAETVDELKKAGLDENQICLVIEKIADAYNEGANNEEKN